MRRVRPACFLFACLATTAAAGCGSATPVGKEVKGVKVQGVLLENGKPIKFKQDETIRVSVSQGDGEAQIASVADVKPEDGSFTIEGPTNQGIPPGKYTIQVEGEVYGAEEPDRFARLFDPEEGTARPPLVVEVGAAEGQTITVDVGKWKASVK